MRTYTCGALLVWASLLAAPAAAQLNGENLLGDAGVKSGSQPPPGTYVGFMYYRYGTDTIRNKDGTRLTMDAADQGSMALHVALPLFVLVSKTRVLGANYGVMMAVPAANGGLEAPGFGLQTDISTAFADMYVVPIQLGWHMARADVTSAFAFYAPTGRYTAGAADNIGKGMWSYELSTGTTLYVDEKKTFSVATTAFWETHSAKRGRGTTHVPGNTLTGVKVGQLLTLEGGAGKTFLQGAATVGMAYYAQYKLTRDEFGFSVTPPSGPVVGKHRVWGFGPDITVPLAARSKLIASVNVRYIWEAGARVKTQGNALILTTTFPIPSVPIK